MRWIVILGAAPALAGCIYYVPVPAQTAAVPAGPVAAPPVVVRSAPVYAYPYPYPYYPYPYYAGAGYPWFGSVAVHGSFRIH
jgi:hypothetical protein